MIKNSALKAGATALTAAAVGFGVAACGSSTTTAKGVVTAPGAGATVEAVTATTAAAATPTTAAATVTTPTTGALASEPVPTKPSGAAPKNLVKQVIVTGTGTAAKSGSSITVNFLGYNYATGKPFSGGSSWTSSTAATPYGPIVLGAGQVIKGWDLGLVGVKAGSRVKLIIPPKDAYAGQKSPLENDTLVFVIDVLKVTGG